jgi:hypothetical protein
MFGSPIIAGVVGMTLTVAAIYENGVLLPERALPLKEHEKVEIVIHTVSPGCGDTSLTPPLDARMAALQRLLTLELPVADWEQMEQEITRGAFE